MASVCVISRVPIRRARHRQSVTSKATLTMAASSLSQTAGFASVVDIYRGHHHDYHHLFIESPPRRPLLPVHILVALPPSRQ